MKTAECSCFHYRLPRFAYRFRVELLLSGMPVQGRCVNLSQTGLLVYFEHPVENVNSHTLRLVLPSWTVDLEVELAYIDGCRSGFRFVFCSEQQRHFMRAIVQHAEHSTRS